MTRRPERTEREAEALRKNLLRRKEQMRQRSAAVAEEDKGEQPEAESEREE
jgi:hypothetical protein